MISIIKLQLSLVGMLATAGLSWGKALPGNENGARTSGYTENKGQVSDQNDKARPDVLCSGTTGDMVYHLKTNGISYQFTRIDNWTEEKDPKLGKKIKRPGPFTIYRLDLDWQGCNLKSVGRVSILVKRKSGFS